MKQCRTCEEFKDFTEFSKKSSSKDGLSNDCKKCSKKIYANWYERRKHVTLEAKRAWRSKNKDKGRLYSSRYRKSNPLKIKDEFQKWRLANLSKRNSVSANYRAKLLKATPFWANADEIFKIYDLAILKTKELGVKHEVDHIVPINSEIVCGLHVEINLQVITSFANKSKGNRVWPDMPIQIN